MDIGGLVEVLILYSMVGVENWFAVKLGSI